MKLLLTGSLLAVVLSHQFLMVYAVYQLAKRRKSYVWYYGLLLVLC